MLKITANFSAMDTTVK